MIDRTEEERIGRVAAMIAESRNAVVFTGAGVSTESGIPDFRSPGGLWTKFAPEDFTLDRFLASPETRRRQWRFLLSGELLREALPNAAHKAIAQLGALGKVDWVITQNIDNLHQKAGSDPDRVLELHGNLRWIRCLDCGSRRPLEEVLGEGGVLDEAPDCALCGGILKPDVIFFGEALPEETLQEATRQANRCDLLIVIGSSLAVYPAASLPLYAKQAGAKLVIVNLTATPADRFADVVIHAAAGEVMVRLLAEVRKRVPGCA
jgi:NAD-dependent deacetylase